MTKTMLLFLMVSLSLAFAPTAFADPIDDVVAANQLTSRDLIFAGQSLTLPGIDAPYVVHPGDTLTTILGSQHVPDAVLAAVVAPEPAPAPLEAPVPVAPPAVHQSVNWDRVASCESGNNWAINTGNGYEGGLQWAPGTWSANKPAGAPSHAYNASREQQIQAAETLYAKQGRSPWPVCGKLG